MTQQARFERRVPSSGQHAVSSPDIQGFCVVGAPGGSRGDVGRHAAGCLALLQGRDPTVPRGPVSFGEGGADTDRARPAGGRKAALSETIAALAECAAGMGLPPPSPAGMALARDFVAALPDDRALPRVAVDEDGDILMAWGGAVQPFALTFEGAVIHAVVAPGARSTHLAPFSYGGGAIPAALLDAVPRE